MIVTVPFSPCWALTHELNDPPDWGTSHYTTDTDAQRALWALRSAVKDDYEQDDEAWVAMLTSKPERSKETCYWIECDNCHRRMRWDDDAAVGNGTHYSPEDVRSLSTFTDAMWTTDGVHRHHCPLCPAIPEHVDVVARIAGPDDFPLPGMG